MRVKQHFFEDDVVAVEFCKANNYYLLMVALRFTVQFFTFEGDLNNITRLEKELNCNGEEIQMMKYINDTLIVGGDSGFLRRYALDDCIINRSFGFLLSWRSLPTRFKRIFKRSSLR